MGSQLIEALNRLAESMLHGEPDSQEIARSCLEQGVPVGEILLKGVVEAWLRFAAWYDRDPGAALRGWMESYTATNRVLRILDSAIEPPKDPPFAAAVVAVRGEGHVLMRDVISLLLKSLGVKVYSWRKGVLPEDLAEAISDPALKWLVLSCTEGGLNDQVAALIRWVKERRPDVKAIAGGPQAMAVGADLVENDIHGMLKALGLQK